MDAAKRERLQHNLAMANEDALVALANRGLYRRALKDLEQDSQLVIEETDDHLIVRGAGWSVTMPPEGPASARDDSGATGITRFVLSATIYLQKHWSPGQGSARSEEAPEPKASESNPTAAPQVVDNENAAVENVAPDKASSSTQALIDEAVDLLIKADVDELTRWSGKGVFLQATARLSSVVEFAISKSPTLAVEFTSDSVRVLLMTDRPERTVKRLLEQFKSTAPKSDLAYWVMLAVLVLKREAGQDLSNVKVLEAEITEAIREDRLRVAERGLKLLASATISGLGHPSTRLAQRFETSAVGAEAARFPRLARLLNSIASDIQLQIARQANADPARLVDRLLMAEAICTAAAKPENNHRAELFGRSRSHYLPAGTLELHGLGAYAWQADSGYEGVTAIFWDEPGQRFVTASQARGDGQDPNFSVNQAYHLSLGWSNSQRMRDHCRQHISLEEAKLNWDGRISSSGGSRVDVKAPTSPQSINLGSRLITNWSAIVEQAQRMQPLGLRVPASSEPLVVIKPVQWGSRWFDELEQQFVWDLVDDAGQVLQMRVPWNEIEESSIEFLEACKSEKEKLWAVLGRITVRQSRICIYPLSLLTEGSSRGDTVLCPHFDIDRIESRNRRLLDQLRAKYGRNKKVKTAIGDEEEDAFSSADWQTVQPLLRDLLLHVDRILHGAIETGAVQLNELSREQLQQARELAGSIGLSTLERALAELKDAQSQPSAAMAHSILRCAYLSKVAGQAATSLSLQ